MKKRIVAVVLAVVLMVQMLGMTGCTPASAERISSEKKSVKSGNEAAVDRALQDRGSEALTEFGVKLLQYCLDAAKTTETAPAENMLLSPLSVLCALSMTANGAVGETKEQMEQVLGLPAEELNPYLKAYLDTLSDEEDGKLSLANSIWFEEGFAVNEDFLQMNADFYQAELYRTVFDEKAVKTINRWVDEKTEGMIPQILDQIPADVVMYLINALAFDARWDHIYEGYQVGERDFTKEDGTVQRTSLMYSRESAYLEDESAIGFIKYYEGQKYAFAALLPREGVSVSDYAASLTGEGLQQLLAEPLEVPVEAAIPKFESEYTTELSGILEQMGMTDAFDSGKADYSQLGEAEENLFLSMVLHKTFIEVGEEGTKAGAATVVAVAEGAAEAPEQLKHVILDRPFLYLLIDCEEKLPLFIGTFMEVE